MNSFSNSRGLRIFLNYLPGGIFPGLLRVLFVLSFSVFPLSTASAVEPKDKISHTIYFYQDKTNQLKLNDLLFSYRKYNFRALDGRTNFGISNAAYWFKIEIPAQKISSNAILEIGYPLLDKINIYTNSNNKWIETRTGDDLPFSSREIKHPNFIKMIPVQSGVAQTLYYKVTSNGPLNISANLWNDSAFYQSDRTTMAIVGASLGALLAILLFNHFIYLSIGDRSFLYYVGYILFMTLFIFSVRGLLSVYILQDNPKLVSQATYLFLYSAMVFELKFIGEVNNTASHSPDLLRMINLACFVLIGVIALGTAIGDRFFLSVVTPYFGISVIVFSAYVIIEGIRAAYKPSKYIGLAYLAIIPTGALYMLGTVGLLKHGNWTGSAFQLGIVIEALLLSFALAYRIRYTEQSLSEVRVDAGQTRIAFSRKLIESRDAERQNLASELHDGMGQNLLAIKNKLSRAIDVGGHNDKNVEDAHNIVQSTILDVRRLSHQLHPHILDRLGLKEAASAVVRDAFEEGSVQIKCLIDDTEVPRRSQVALHLYRIVQEGVKNILTHADPEYVNVEMFQLADNIILRIENLSDTFDLAWMPASDLHEGFGLSSIRERVELLAGECQFHQNRTAGFKIEVTVPFTK